MVINLKKGIEDLKIGLFGTRKSLLADELDKQKIKYYEVNNITSIDNSFDFIFASGVYSIIKNEYLKIPVYGIIGFHETPLPEGRGNAPIQWTIENKRINLTITAFKLIKEMDAGDIIYQYNISLSNITSFPRATSEPKSEVHSLMFGSTT